MAGLQDIATRLQSAPVATFHVTVVRCVGLIPLTSHGTPDSLFTSGKANRFNPAGVACVYFSEDEKTARAEYARRLGPAGRSPLEHSSPRLDSPKSGTWQIRRRASSWV